MEIKPITLAVEVGTDTVTALLYQAEKKKRAGMTLILGHGAGAGQLHPFMTLFAKGLAERGLDVMTFNFVYMERRKGVPDPKAKLEACYQAVIEAAQNYKKLKGNRLAIGGKSMGGRIASQVAAANAEGLVGLVFLGYPLHPPGNLEKLRDAHLKDIRTPMLFIQGARDAFGTVDEIEAVVARLGLPATVYSIEGGDHSLKVPKSAGIPQQQVYENAMDEIARCLV